MRLGSSIAVAIAAAAGILTLAWELPHTAGVAQKSQKKKKKKKSPQTFHAGDDVEERKPY